MLGASVSRKVHDHLPVLLKGLSREDLRVHIRRVDVAGDVMNVDHATGGMRPIPLREKEGLNSPPCCEIADQSPDCLNC